MLIESPKKNCGHDELEAEKWYNGMESFMHKLSGLPTLASSHLKNLAQVMAIVQWRLLRITDIGTAYSLNLVLGNKRKVCRTRM